MIALLFASVFASFASADSAVPSADTISNPYELVRSTIPPTAELATVPWFPEFLEYEVKWGLLSVGEANLRTDTVEDFNGSAAVRIVSQATSSGFCDTFYKVRDLNESWIEAHDFYSLGYSKKLREGSFFRDEWVVYDYPHGMFFSRTTNRNGTFSTKQGTIPGEVQDILSSMYYIRNKPLHVKDEIQLVANTKENWPLVVKVLYRTSIQVPAGKFDAIVVQPFLLKEGIFVQKNRDLQIWMTDDARHIPVAMSVHVFFGHVRALLLRINGKGVPPKSATSN